MMKLQLEAATYGERQAGQTASAAQTATFFIMTGIDLGAASSAPSVERARLICRLERLLERERLKGMRGHWSYDLGRHIALKQALNRIAQELEAERHPAVPFQ